MDREAKQSCHSAADLWPGGERNFRVAFVEEGDGFVGEVEAKGGRVGHALFVPKPGGKGDEGGFVEVSDGLPGFCWNTLSVSFFARIY